MELYPKRIVTYPPIPDILKQAGSGRRLPDKPGILWVIGDNGQGEFGFGDTASKLDLTRCEWSQDKQLIDMASGYKFCVYRGQNGEFWSCGYNNVGQCGLNHANNETRVPAKIEYFEKNGYIVKNHNIAPPSDHMFWITEDGDIYGNGRNTNGTLGCGDKSNKTEPTLIKFFKEKALNVIHATGTYEYSMALCDNGRVYSTGYAPKGGLGHGGNPNATSDWKEIEALKGILYGVLVLEYLVLKWFEFKFRR